jgi:hypothetical protein
MKPRGWQPDREAWPHASGTEETSVKSPCARADASARRPYPRLSLCLVLLALLRIALSAGAQTYSIDAYKIAGGGGTSTSAVHSVTGTIGQPDAGAAMSGGDYSLTGGFWAVYAVQTAGAPYLWVMKTLTNTVCVWWAVSDKSWGLQATTNLATFGSAWSACSYVTNGANCVYVEPLPQNRRFFRLRLTQ